MSTSQILTNNINAHNNTFNVKVDYTNTGEAKDQYLVIGESDLQAGIKIRYKIKCTKSQAIDIIDLLGVYDNLRSELD